MSDSEDRYNSLYRKGKKYFKANQYEKCLDALKGAYEIKPSEQLQTKINKMEAIINLDEPEPEIKFKPDENKILIDNKFYVNSSSYNKLYDYQREGVLWLFKLFETRKGGILADDMGLGKTVQVIFFLRELFESDLIKTALIVMPKSLLINWKREFSKWAPDLEVHMYTENERERNLNRVHRRGGILLTTYGTILHNWEDLNYNSTFKWNVLALDEGHRIKNPSSKTFKAINAIRADNRLVMTGTAVQNKLKELWALFDFTHQGSLLGNYPTFKVEYEIPLTASRKKDATEVEKMYGDEISTSIKRLIKPFFLRRTKEGVTRNTGGTGINSVPKLMKKNDLIMWIQMTDAQIDIYQRFLQLDDVKQLLTKSEKRSPLMELNILKKICDHPRLLPPDHCAEMGLTDASSINDLDITILQQESGKMEFLLRLLVELVADNHKCLVFSQSKVVLNIVARILAHNDICHLRLDGDVLKTVDRQNIVDSFNTDPSYQVLLLTSQVGGVGLTLTGADRAIIYDLSWNPSIDAQAVDRLYRIGQLKDVVVYRLITCGTVEEKIYRRQIFKDSVNRQTTGIEKTDNNPYRYFTGGELVELFTLDDPHQSATQIQLESMHTGHRRPDQKLDLHLQWLMGFENVFGVSHHDLMFTKEEEEVKVDEETRGRLMDNRRQAEDRLVKEALVNANDDEGELRLKMSQMSLGSADKKIKVKVKEGRLKSEDMFIPNKDVKRQLNVFNVPQWAQLAPVDMTKYNRMPTKKVDEYVVPDRKDEDARGARKSIAMTVDDDSVIIIEDDEELAEEDGDGEEEDKKDQEEEEEDNEGQEEEEEDNEGQEEEDGEEEGQEEEEEDKEGQEEEDGDGEEDDNEGQEEEEDNEGQEEEEDNEGQEEEDEDKEGQEEEEDNEGQEEEDDKEGQEEEDDKEGQEEEEGDGEENYEDQEEEDGEKVALYKIPNSESDEEEENNSEVGHEEYISFRESDDESEVILRAADHRSTTKERRNFISDDEDEKEDFVTECVNVPANGNNGAVVVETEMSEDSFCEGDIIDESF